MTTGAGSRPTCCSRRAWRGSRCSSSCRCTTWRTRRCRRARSTSATRSRGPGATTADAISTYQAQFVRSHRSTPAIATVLRAASIGYPLAYFIAFRGGRWKNLLLLLVIAPFFVTYLIRTLAWQTILADERHRRGRAAQTIGAARRRATGCWRRSTAVVAGITYNYPAVHGAAALRQPGADRHAADRGGAGPLRARSRRRSCA